jgi:hypothetical protein
MACSERGNAEMATESTIPPVPSAKAPRPIHINVTPSGKIAMKHFEREMATYERELPRLLAEGYESKYALIRGDEILSIWDTVNDGIQAGCERFGLEPYFLQKIDARDIERYALLRAWQESQCQD